MAHEIHTEDGDVFGEVRSGGKSAWHGIGDPVAEGTDCETAFTQIGLDWPTEMAPVQALASRGIINLDKQFAHVRKDTGLLLGMVTSEYRPFENMDLARFADSLAGADKACTVETVGSLYSCKRVFALVKLPHEIRVGKGGEDVIKEYVLVANGHGGYAETACYPTSVRVVCANTLRLSQTDAVKGIRFRHSGNFESKVAQARLVLGTAIAESKEFESRVLALAATRLSRQQLTSYLVRTFEDIYGKADPLAPADYVEAFQAKRKGILEQWTANLAHDQQLVAGIAGTAWAAYNAISMFEDHQRGRKGDGEARVASNLFGPANKDKRVAFQNALALVK